MLPPPPLSTNIKSGTKPKAESSATRPSSINGNGIASPSRFLPPPPFSNGSLPLHQSNEEVAKASTGESRNVDNEVNLPTPLSANAPRPPAEADPAPVAPEKLHTPPPPPTVQPVNATADSALDEPVEGSAAPFSVPVLQNISVDEVEIDVTVTIERFYVSFESCRHHLEELSASLRKLCSDEDSGAVANVDSSLVFSTLEHARSMLSALLDLFAAKLSSDELLMVENCSSKGASLVLSLVEVRLDHPISIRGNNHGVVFI